MNVLRTGMDKSISHIRIMGMVHKLYKDLRRNIFASLRISLLSFFFTLSLVNKSTPNNS